MKKWFLLVAGVAIAFAIGYGASAKAYPGGGVYGRAEWRGYFINQLDASGTNVLPKNYGGEAFPSWVDSADPFIFFIESQLSGNNQQRTGATFIIQTMIGSSRTYPPSAADIAEWESRVRFAQSMGRIHWRVGYSFVINSYYQGPAGGGAPNDDAFYDQNTSAPVILFTNASGGVQYAIKVECANPVGNLAPLESAVNWSASGRSTVSDPNPVPGEDINFFHYVKNNGPTSTNGYHIWAQTMDHPSDAIIRSGYDIGAFAAGEEKLVDIQPVKVPIGAAPGSQICQKIYFVYASSAANSAATGPPVCATVRYDFTLTPSITLLVNGSPPIGASVAEPGDTIQFQYAVRNSGPTATTNVNCTIFKNTIAGYHTAPAPPESTAGWSSTNAGTGCPRSFPGGPSNTTLNGADETFPASATDLNKSICRTLSVDPATVGGGAASVESCVQIGARPFLRVYSGDVSVGNGQPPTCAVSSSGAISWSKEAPNYGGAGAQWGVMAIGQIKDFASSLGNSSQVGAGRTLAFANTTASGSDVFGGSFGSLPCITDYYARSTQTPTAALPSTNLGNAALAGIHSFTTVGPITLSGTLAGGQRTVIYVNGDVLINGDIAFPASWTSSTPPMFQLVAKGNIYISQNVTRIDGVYVAQPTNPTASNGVIYTCANAALPATAVATGDTALYSKCKNKLTINGSFTARQVQFLRTPGTRSQASDLDTSASPNVAEVFNFSPALWMGQPPVPSSSAGQYDAITSLPPVL